MSQHKNALFETISASFCFSSCIPVAFSVPIPPASRRIFSNWATAAAAVFNVSAATVVCVAVAVSGRQMQRTTSVCLSLGADRPPASMSASRPHAWLQLGRPLQLQDDCNSVALRRVASCNDRVTVGVVGIATTVTVAGKQTDEDRHGQWCNKHTRAYIHLEERNVSKERHFCC